MEPNRTAPPGLSTGQKDLQGPSQDPSDMQPKFTSKKGLGKPWTNPDVASTQQDKSTLTNDQLENIIMQRLADAIPSAVERELNKHISYYDIQHRVRALEEAWHRTLSPVEERDIQFLHSLADNFEGMKMHMQNLYDKIKAHDKAHVNFGNQLSLVGRKAKYAVEKNMEHGSLIAALTRRMEELEEAVDKHEDSFLSHGKALSSNAKMMDKWTQGETDTIHRLFDRIEALERTINDCQARSVDSFRIPGAYMDDDHTDIKDLISTCSHIPAIQVLGYIIAFLLALKGISSAGDGLFLILLGGLLIYLLRRTQPGQGELGADDNENADDKPESPSHVLQSDSRSGPPVEDDERMDHPDTHLAHDANRTEALSHQSFPYPFVDASAYPMLEKRRSEFRGSSEIAEAGAGTKSTKTLAEELMQYGLMNQQADTQAPRPCQQLPPLIYTDEDCEKSYSSSDSSSSENDKENKRRPLGELPIPLSPEATEQQADPASPLSPVREAPLADPFQGSGPIPGEELGEFILPGAGTF